MFAIKPIPFLPLDINTQRDFFDKGAPMASEDADVARRNIRDLAYHLKRAALPVLAATDAHVPDDPEFKEYGLPPHALLESAGQRKIYETQVRQAAIIPVSGRRQPWPKLRELRLRGGQIVLEKKSFDLFDNPACGEVVRAFNTRELILYGATFEHDIRATAETARTRGWEVTVVEDAVTMRSKDKALKVRGRLRRRGVVFEPAEEINIRILLYQKRQERERRQRKHS